MKLRHAVVIILILAFHTADPFTSGAQEAPKSNEQLLRLLKQFPDADKNNDGKLTWNEASWYRDKMLAGLASQMEGRRGVPRTFNVNPGWKEDRFPENAVCYLAPDQVREIYEQRGKSPKTVTFSRPTDGALRIVGVGHSFMVPGYKTLPWISQASGFKQPLHTHTGGGMTGSARYKWEQENGIFGFDGKPYPKLLASIANGQWEAMVFGPYFQDRPEYFSCWIDYCLKYNPEMKFYISDAWPQLEQIKTPIESESDFTPKLFEQLGAERNALSDTVIEPLRQKYPNKIYVIPTSDAMVLAAKAFMSGDLPGVEGIHRVVGKKERSLWRDKLGHLGPGFEWLEGYVFYSTLYQRSAVDLKTSPAPLKTLSFPGENLDIKFREIAWEAVSNHPYAGIQ